MPRFSLKQMLFGFVALAMVLSVYRLANYRRLVPLSNEIRRIEFSPDGSQIAFRHYASNDAGVVGKHYEADISSFVAITDVAMLESWQTVHHDFAAGNQGPASDWNWRHRFDFSSDGKLLNVWKDMHGGPDVWDVKNKKWIGAQNPSRNSSAGTQRSPDGRWMTTFNRQWEVFLTDTTSPNAYPQITLWKSVNGFSRDSKRIVVSTNKAIEVWQLEPRELVGKFDLPIEPLNRVTLVELSPDEDTLAIRCEDGLRVYSLSTSQERIILPEYFVAEHFPNGGWRTREAGGDTFGLEFSPDVR